MSILHAGVSNLTLQGHHFFECLAMTNKLKFIVLISIKNGKCSVV